MKSTIVFFMILFTSFSLFIHEDVRAEMVYKSNGFVMGDFIKTQNYLTLSDNQVIDTESLPLTGPVTPWLDLRSVEYKKVGKKHVVELTWQLFATVENVQSLATPEVVVKTVKPNLQTIKIPPHKFYVSPTIPLELNNIWRYQSLKPNQFDEVKPLWLLLLSYFVFLIFLILWLWVKDKISWLPRHPKPFTILMRQLKKQGCASKSVFENHHLALIQHALNHTALETLYPSTLDKLFARAPFLIQDSALIREYYVAAWTMFYKDENLNIPTQPNLEWIARAAISERLKSL